MKATIVKHKIQEKYYGKIKSHTVYTIPEINSEYQSGFWNIIKLKKKLIDMGFTEINISDGGVTKMNF